MKAARKEKNSVGNQRTVNCTINSQRLTEKRNFKPITSQYNNTTTQKSTPFSSTNREVEKPVSTCFMYSGKTLKENRCTVIGDSVESTP